MTLETVNITHEEHFRSLRPDWNRLAEATRSNSVFLRHEWYDAAWQWLKQDSDLKIIGVRKNGTLIGICPFIGRRRSYRRTKVRVVEFLSVPDTQLCDMLAAPEDHALVVQTVGAHLSQSRHDWDIVILDKLSSHSVTASVFQAVLTRCGLKTISEPSASDAVVNLSGDWEDFYARRSRRLKKGNNLIANRLRRAHKAIRLDWIRAAKSDIDTFEEVLETIIAISSRSWKNETAFALERAGPNAFIRTLTRHAWSQGWLSLWVLHLNGVPAAMEYQLIDRGEVYALRADFDQAYSHLSPGAYLNWKLLEELFNKGLKYYHMGPGDNPYKTRWAEDFPSSYKITGFNKTTRGRAMGWLEADVRPMGRRMFARIRNQMGRIALAMGV